MSVSFPVEVWSGILQYHVNNPAVPNVSILFRDIHRNNLEPCLNKMKQKNCYFLIDQDETHSRREYPNKRIYQIFRKITSNYQTILLKEHSKAEDWFNTKSYDEIKKAEGEFLKTFQTDDKKYNSADDFLAMFAHIEDEHLMNFFKPIAKKYPKSFFGALFPRDAMTPELFKLFVSNDILFPKDISLVNYCLKYLPPEIKVLENITSLRLSNNNLTRLPEEIGCLTSLTTLDLSYNQLRTLPDEIGNLSSLEALFLSGNSLLDLPESLNKCKKLKNLDMNDKNRGFMDLSTVFAFIQLSPDQKDRVRQLLSKNQELTQYDLFGDEEKLDQMIQWVSSSPVNCCSVS